MNLIRGQQLQPSEEELAISLYSRNPLASAKGGCQVVIGVDWFSGEPMIKFWIYLFIFFLLALFGLMVGSANDGRVFFDFLFVKKEVSIATILIIGVLFGFALGLYSMSFLALKLYVKNKILSSQLKKSKKEVEKHQDEQKNQMPAVPNLKNE